MLTPIATDSEEYTNATRTYKLDLENKRIVGMVDGLESISQNAIKTLLTERYAYEIYSSDIGVALAKYVGEDFDYVKANLRKEIEEALSLDERIIEIQEFSFEKTGLDQCHAQIYLNTTEGQIVLTGEVSI